MSRIRARDAIISGTAAVTTDASGGTSQPGLLVEETLGPAQPAARDRGLELVLVLVRELGRHVCGAGSVSRLEVARDVRWRANCLAVLMPDGHRRSSVYYSILEAEWPAVKARLQEKLKAYVGM